MEGRDDAEALWKRYVALDWPGLTVPVEDGGSRLSTVELALVLEELGRVADPTPLLATTSQYVPVIRECADDDQGRRFLSVVCEGRTGAVASGADAVRATAVDDGWVLHGAAHNVVDGDRADEVAVIASVDGGVGVFVVHRGDHPATSRSGGSLLEVLHRRVR